MDIRKIIREEVRVILMEEKSESFFSKLRSLMAPNGKVSTHFKTRNIKDWPDVPSDGDDSVGTLDLENNEMISLDSKKLKIMTGGDWQESWYVEIVNAPGGLKVLNHRLPKKGEFKSSDRMSTKEISEVMHSDHPMHKSFENFIKEVKSGLKSYSPQSNTYGDERYEEEIVDGPKFDKDESIVHVTWNIGGHDKSKDKVGYKDMTHEARDEERFQKWVKDRFWHGKGDKFKLKNKEYKIKCYAESLGEDRVRYSISFKEL